MKTALSVSVVCSVLTFGLAAAAQEAPEQVDVRDAPADAVPPESSTKPKLGYQVELGAASTHVSRGTPKDRTKETAATEGLALLRVKNVGGGTVVAGASFSSPFAALAAQPKASVEIIPQAHYRHVFGAVDTSAGFQLKLYPKADDVDALYEGVLKASIPNKLVTPTIEIYPEIYRKRGVYSALGAEHDFVMGVFLLKPRVSFGGQGYDEKSEKAHVNDATASLLAKLSFGSGYYASLRPAFAMLVGPDHYLKDSSAAGRSVGYVALGLGVER